MMLFEISLSDMNALCDSDTSFVRIFIRWLAMVLDTICTRYSKGL